MTNNQLQAKINAVNAANEYANKLYAEMAEFFRLYVGQKIFKVNGILLDKFQKQMPKLPNSLEITVYHRYNNYSLHFLVRVCKTYSENGGKIAEYYETSVYVGDIDKGILTKICDYTPGKCNYTMEQVLKNREAAKAAEKAYEEARDNCFPFNDR